GQRPLLVAGLTARLPGLGVALAAAGALLVVAQALAARLPLALVAALLRPAPPPCCRADRPASRPGRCPCRRRRAAGSRAGAGCAPAAGPGCRPSAASAPSLLPG